MHSSTCDSLKAALEKRLRASSSAPFNSSIQVRAISDGGPPAYIVKAAQSCGPILAEQLSEITGHIFFPYEPSVVLFHDSIRVWSRLQSVPTRWAFRIAMVAGATSPARARRHSRNRLWDGRFLARRPHFRAHHDQGGGACREALCAGAHSILRRA